MTNTSIDHYRTELKHQVSTDITELEIQNEDTDIHSKLNYDDLIRLIQTLPPGYRTVFNLFAIDGYSHEEIAEELGISVDTSKSNLFKARQKLRSLLESNNERTNTSTEHNSVIIINEQFEPKQDRQFFQAGA